eukprot:1147131-Pelagomonas_calceolata.AAC.8
MEKIVPGWFANVCHVPCRSDRISRKTNTLENSGVGKKYCSVYDKTSRQMHIHLVEVENCEDTRPKIQFKASKRQHHDLCHHLMKASAQDNLHTILLGRGGIYTRVGGPPHFGLQSSEPLKELGLDIHKATKLALKLHAYSVQYA